MDFFQKVCGEEGIYKKVVGDEAFEDNHGNIMRLKKIQSKERIIVVYEQEVGISEIPVD